MKIQKYIKAYKKAKTNDKKIVVAGELIVALLNNFNRKVGSNNPKLLLTRINNYWLELVNVSKKFPLFENDEYIWHLDDDGFKECLAQWPASKDINVAIVFEMMGWDYEACYNPKKEEDNEIVFIEYV